MNYSNVFLPHPLNRRHPLAQGLLGFWMALPGLEGGRKLYNLAAEPLGRGFHPNRPNMVDGTLNNSSNVPANGPRWAASEFGPTLSFDGLDDLVNVSGGVIPSDNGFPSNSGGFSIASFARSKSLGTQIDDQTLFSCGSAYLYYFTAKGGVPNFYTNPVWVPGVGSGPALGTWNMYGATRIRTSSSIATIGLYLNGKVNFKSTNVSTVGSDSTTSYIGRRVDGLTPRPTFNGEIASTMIYNRFLSDAEMYDLNILMRNGYMGLLNRVTQTQLVISIPVSATLTAVCTLSSTLTLYNPDETDIYSSENLRPMFDFLIPLVNQATGSNYTQCDVKFVFNNGRQVRFPDCD